MSKREHSITVRYTDEEFDRLNNEYQQRLAAVRDGLSFGLSSMIRIKTLSPDRAQGSLCKTSRDVAQLRRTA